MAPREAQQSSNHLRCPGKIFLIGEYAVLAGAPALVAAVEPFFTLVRSPGISPKFAPESPAGRLLSWARTTHHHELTGYAWFDPLQGAGGLGASTAQFVLIYRILSRDLGLSSDWQDCWKLYRELTAGGRFPPSGADLVAQFVAQEVNSAIEVDLMKMSAELIHSELPPEILLFSATSQAGRKVATHLHLDELDSRVGVETLAQDLDGSLRRALDAFRFRDWDEFGSQCREYAEILANRGLESPHTSEDRRSLGILPGVVGIKGCGAMQADAVLVVMSGESSDSDRGNVVRAAVSRGLRKIT